jgi:hypothetical protein
MAALGGAFRMTFNQVGTFSNCKVSGGAARPTGNAASGRCGSHNKPALHKSVVEDFGIGNLKT